MVCHLNEELVESPQRRKAGNAMRLDEIEKRTGFTPNEARWRIDKLKRRGLIRCNRVKGIRHERECGRRAVRILLRVRGLEEEFGLSAIAAIGVVDQSWQQKGARLLRKCRTLLAVQFRVTLALHVELEWPRSEADD